MDIFNDTSISEGRSATAGKGPKPDNRWTLIFIGNHGKTITINRFKGMVLLAGLVVCLSLAIAAGLLYLSLNSRQEKKQLESDLQDLKAQIKAIRYEKDVLMTKLVLAQSRPQSSPAKIPPQQIESTAPQQIAANDKKPGQSTQPAKKRENAPLEKKAESPATVNPSESGLSVALENFKISPRVDENLLRVQFKIKNTSPNSQRVSGHAIVVLKGEQLPQNKWLSIPAVALSDGKPTGRQRGYTFGINYFKTMRFKANLPKSLSVYQTATVFIFTRKGELLLEQDYPVNLSAGLPASTSTPPSPAASNSPATTQPAASSPPATSPDDLRNTLKNPTN
jgi:hypothetical protein